MDISILYQVLRTDWNIVAFISTVNVAQTRAFKDWDTDGLTHFQLSKKQLDLLYSFPGFHIHKEEFLIGPSLPEE